MHQAKKHFSLFAYILALTAITLTFQNCTSNKSLQFSSSEKEEVYSSGNGQPYEGKPKIGHYYQVNPGFTCNGGKPHIAGSVHVGPARITVNKVSQADCSQTSQPVQLPDLESPVFNPDFLGFESGIYKWADVEPNPLALPAETWCRGVDGSFDVVVEDPLSATLQATVRSASGLSRTFNPTRQQDSQRVVYQDGSSKLTVELGPASADKTSGKFTAQYNGKPFGGAVLCRSTRRAPVGMRYLVLTKDMSNGNLGGIAGANAFCLSQLQANPFKGKATVSLSPARVRAFICDDGQCNGFPGNSVVSYARAGDATVGGQTFVTDAVGSGPGSAAFWDTPGIFGGVYYYWQGRGNTASGTLWPTSPLPAEPRCQNWTSSVVSDTGSAGQTSNDWNGRWNTASKQCSDLYNLMCIVEPDP